MRTAVREVPGRDKYDLCFERLLSAFYADADVAFPAEIGLNCVRTPLNHPELESDAKPFAIIEDGSAIWTLLARRPTCAYTSAS